MNANAILDKILQDARENASVTMEEANQKAAQLKADADLRMRRARDRMQMQASEDAELARMRMERMAELEERKRLLADKRAMMDRAFALALEKLESMPVKDSRAFLLETVTRLADGDETVIPGAEHAAWLDERFLPEANLALKKAGKPGQLRLSEERRPGVTGLVLTKNNTEMSCTYEAILNSLRLEMEADVAALLFPEG